MGTRVGCQCRRRGSLGSRTRRLRGVSRSAAVRSLLTSCPKGGETARPRAGRPGCTCSDVPPPPPPPPGGRRWPGGRGKKATRGSAAGRADRDKRERGEGSGQSCGPAGFPGPPDCCEGPTVPRQDGASAGGVRGA